MSRQIDDSRNRAASPPPFPRLAATALTPPVPGGIATVVVWGTEAGSFMRAVFPGIEDKRILYRRLKDGRDVVDEVIGVGAGLELVSVTAVRSGVTPGTSEAGPQAEAISAASRDRASRRISRMIC